MAKEEIARFEQFLISTQCLQKSSAAEASKIVDIWEKVNVFRIRFIPKSNQKFESLKVHWFRRHRSKQVLKHCVDIINIVNYNISIA